ncbi:hypothetical protein GCM10009111_15800 [Colwellia asteriadis]|uniref:HNH endonuclease n=1 Tax=Colwellia asteriadis TaxID=517723 RepID=A0ABN1L6B1_9GAMM
MMPVITETPFDKRHCCWFCGEPNSGEFTFPDGERSAFNCPHVLLSVPSCDECNKIAKSAAVHSIWQVNHFVKSSLMVRYNKHLAIGINWTEEELATSEFEHGNFAGFARSAWFVYEVARGRVNYQSWPLVIDGVEYYDSEPTLTFTFDDVVYPSLDYAIKHYAKTFFIDRHYFSAVLYKLSKGDITPRYFAQTVRFCRLLVNASATERQVAFKQLS